MLDDDLEARRREAAERTRRAYGTGLTEPGLRNRAYGTGLTERRGTHVEKHQDRRHRNHGLERRDVAVACDVLPGPGRRCPPGHTPGSYVLIVSSGTDRAYLLGDVVACPLQLTENDISFISDVDPALAARTRESLFRELEGQQAAIGMDHFPGLEFQRIVTGTGRQWATF
jgi:hypothetical protein